jgi:hypothetical protein
MRKTALKPDMLSLTPSYLVARINRIILLSVILLNYDNFVFQFIIIIIIIIQHLTLFFQFQIQQTDFLIVTTINRLIWQLKINFFL